MKIFVEGKEAFLKKGTSFEFIAENRLFSGSDEYTLSITFPIVDCPRNRAIFGLLYRKDVDIEKVNFACELRDTNFYKMGVLAIVEVSQSEIKGQFLDGMSAQNFIGDFDEIYINELDLGDYEYVNMSKWYLCLSGIDRYDCIVVLSCFILCLCCDGTTTGVVVPFFVTLL
jgi:hypothetical protein